MDGKREQSKRTQSSQDERRNEEEALLYRQWRAFPDYRKLTYTFFLHKTFYIKYQV